MEQLPKDSPSIDLDWALPGSQLMIHGKPLNFPHPSIEYKHFAGPQEGFGQLWHKVYRMEFPKKNITAAKLVQTWKNQFPKFWTKGNYFIGAKGEMKPRDVAVLNLAGPRGITAPGGLPMISTGVLVVSSNDSAFTFITLMGHMFAGIIDFSSHEEGDQIIVLINILIRASDIFYELGMRFGVITAIEDRFWTAALRNLGAYFGEQAEVKISSELIDSTVQWSRFWNIWNNAAIRTTIYTLTHPLKWIPSKNSRKGE
jgi:hypothetical protein